MNSTVLIKKEKNFRNLYSLILVLFSIEFIGEGGLSVYRTLIFPLVLVGMYYCFTLPTNNNRTKVHILAAFIYLSFFSFCLALDDENFLFPIFTIPLAVFIFCFHGLKYPIEIDYVKSFVWFSLPQIVAFFAGVVEFQNGRFIGIHNDPNFCGLFLSISAISCITLLIRNNVKWWAKIFYTILLLLTLYFLFLTGSRGAMLSVLLVLFVFFLRSQIKMKWKVIIILLVVWLVHLAYNYVLSLPDFVDFEESPLDFVISRFKPDRLEGGSSRTLIWGKVWERITESPVYLFITLGREAAMAGFSNDFTHNSYLDFLVYFGIIPGSLFLAYLFAMIAKGFVRFNKFSEKEKDSYICGVAVLFQIFFLSAFSQKVIWIFIFFIISMASKRLIIYDKSINNSTCL